MFYKVAPGYELVVAGTFPNSRFFSVTVYDSHAAETSGFIDNQILPLDRSMVNPLLPNVGFIPNQLYGITVGFGGPVPASVSPGCSTSGSTIDQNFLDASQIHQGLTWNGYPGLPSGFPVHLTGLSSGGQIIIRSYDDISDEPAPIVIVRDLATGCGVPLNIAKNIVTVYPAGGLWSDQAQIQAHDNFAFGVEQYQCFRPDPLNSVQWNRSADYVPGDNVQTAYLKFFVSATRVQSIASGNQFMRFRFQLPKMPNTPCTTGACALTGLEELRYRSISFEDGKTTLASIADSDFVQDPNGNVTLIVGFGAQPPAYVTAANYYTYFDISKVPNYLNLQLVEMRDILPNIAFHCSNFNVPQLYTEYNPEFGYMGNYVPTVDYLTADLLPAIATPLSRPNSCEAAVPQTPTTCTAK